MPSLMAEAVDKLIAQSAGTCDACGKTLHHNYCRQCDEYTEDGHERGCKKAEHVNHRGYDEHAPAIGRFAGWIYERDHGSYRLNAPRGPNPDKVEPKPVSTKPL